MCQAGGGGADRLTCCADDCFFPQEEISAVFGDGEVTGDGPPRPRPPTRPPQPDSPTALPKPRLERRQSCAPPVPPRRRTPSVRKPRRASAPALPHAYDGAASARQPRTDPHLQAWSRGLLRDFRRLVDQELRALGGAVPEATNGTPDASTPDGRSAEEEEEEESAAEGEEARSQDAGAAGWPVRRAAGRAMGATQSNERSVPWAGDPRTYTLPRTGGRRSVSVSGTVADVVFRTSAGHPDAPDPACRLLRINPRLSRSHSLDESCPLSPWALHHLALIDAAHTSPPPTPAHTNNNKAKKRAAMGAAQPEATPSAPATPASGAARQKLIRKTGRPELFNEQWRPPTNGWPEPPPTPKGPPPPSPAIPITNPAASAFTPEDLRKGVSESWAWADEDDACSLTDRPCDSKDCPHCRAKDGGQRATLPRLLVDPPHDTDGSVSDDPTGASEERQRQERRSEPALAGTTSPEELDGRRHTLPTQRSGGASRLIVSPPVFNTSSWEALPPADELEVELEEKTITEALALPPAPPTPTLLPAPPSPSSSHSLNSSLSSLSHLSVHRDHSEYGSWPPSPATDPTLCPEVFFLPGFTPSPLPPAPPSPLPPPPPSPLAIPSLETEQPSQPVTVSHPPPIMGTLLVAPPTPQGTAGDIIFSVTIPPAPPSPPATPREGEASEARDTTSGGTPHTNDSPDGGQDTSWAATPEHFAVNGLDDPPPPAPEEGWKPSQPRRPALPVRQRSFSLDERRTPTRPRSRATPPEVRTVMDD